MNALLLFADGGGQIEQIASTFGVDWPHLISQMISFSIVCALLYWLAYKPVLKMLATRRELIAQGLANSEKIEAELAKTEAQRQEVIARANVESTRLIEEARAAAAQLREQEAQKATSCRRTDHRQGARGCRSGSHAHACGVEARRGPVGGGDYGKYHRQDSDSGRSATIG